jgi:hypothetical protein
MVNTTFPENAVMNLKFPDVPSPNRKAKYCTQRGLERRVCFRMVGNMPRYAESEAGVRLDTLPRSLAQQTGVSVSSA